LNIGLIIDGEGVPLSQSDGRNHGFHLVPGKAGDQLHVQVAYLSEFNNDSFLVNILFGLLGEDLPEAGGSCTPGEV